MATDRAALLARRVNDERTAKGWTQVDLAREAEVTKGYVSKLESGKAVRPSEAELGRVLRAFGFTNVGEFLAASAAGGHSSRATSVDDDHVRRVAREEAERYFAEQRQRERLDQSTTEVPEAGLRGELGAPQLPRQTRNDDRWPTYNHIAAALRLLDVENFAEPSGDADLPRGLSPAALGPRGYALTVKGDSLSGWHGPAGDAPPIREGDLVWINPENDQERVHNWPHVLAVREQPGGEPKAVVKLLRGKRFYSVTQGADGAPVEREMTVHEVLACTPMLAHTAQATVLPAARGR